MTFNDEARAEARAEAERRYPGPTGTYYAFAAEKEWHAQQLDRREGFTSGAEWHASLPIEVTEDMVQRFKDAWHEADERGEAGNRVRSALAAALSRATPFKINTDAPIPYGGNGPQYWIDTTAVSGPAKPVITQYEVDRHAEKQGISYADAWRYFERMGGDLSQVDDQYSRM